MIIVFYSWDGYASWALFEIPFSSTGRWWYFETKTVRAEWALESVWSDPYTEMRTRWRWGWGKGCWAGVGREAGKQKDLGTSPQSPAERALELHLYNVPFCSKFKKMKEKYYFHLENTEMCKKRKYIPRVLPTAIVHLSFQFFLNYFP